LTFFKLFSRVFKQYLLGETTTASTESTTTSTAEQQPTEAMPSGLRVRRGAEPVEPQDFKYIKPETLDPKNFIICDGECQDEGFWALIAFGAGAGLALIFFIIGFCASRRVQIALGTVSTIILLGLIGGYLYVGIVGILGWEYAGGCAGGVGALIIIINGGICMRSKTTSSSSVKVTEKDVDKYWDNMKEEYQETAVKLE